jgi:hypothetical protein
MAGVMRGFMIWILPTDITGAVGTEGHAARMGDRVVVRTPCEDNIKTNLQETG